LIFILHIKMAQIFPGSSYQTFIYLSRYARWIPKHGRREYFPETIDRYLDFFEGHLKRDHDFDLGEYRNKLKKYMLKLDVMPSMRAFMTAGEALERDNIAGYNCAYVAIDNWRKLDEIIYILMCGTGVGFSVERQFIANMSHINKTHPTNNGFKHIDETIIVEDSKMGWAIAYRQLISNLVDGKIPKWDVSNIRKKGEILKTFGGRASGPDPLVELFNFTIEIFTNSEENKLNSLEIHDIVCKIASVVVCGGVRRSALISLSNLSDDRMRDAKTGQYYINDKQRALSNNSVAYQSKPNIGAFMKEWKSLYDSKSGERGIVNRAALKVKVSESGRRNPNHEFGCNPCSEIILRSCEFCNLSEVVIRPNDDINTLKEKVEIATIIGTLQSTLTTFKYINDEFKKNCDEERLLGVSLTGIMDNTLTNTVSDKLKNTLKELKEHAINTNNKWSKMLGINRATAITTVKPSGTVSQLVNSSSGIHCRWSEYYIRTVRNDKTDPISQFLISSGVPYEEDLHNSNAWVFSFPHKSPDQSIYRNNVTPLDQLNIWKCYQDYWCEHKPSASIYIDEHEWLHAGAWVYDNFDSVSGISFFPKSDHIYKQAPYIECNKEEYDHLCDKHPTINWEDLSKFEENDNTTINQELACSSGFCELI
jgi:ribonucleoside-triphosphate reductase (thioredoxin)